MTDIHQWRRKIQHSRTRTPAVEIDGTDGMASPTTPRKVIKPKLSSYFGQNGNSILLNKTDLPSPEDIANPQWPSSSSATGPFPNPEAESLIDAIMSQLLADLHHGLDPRFNCMLLQIFEAFRNITDEREIFRSQLEAESDRLVAMQQVFQRSVQQWEREKREYKAEVKRLELILAKGQQGLAGVTLARQDSLISQRRRKASLDRNDDRTMETVFEFLQKTRRYEDKAWSSQRATMRKRPSSPSADMRRLSSTLVTKASMTNTYHADLPFGTPPVKVSSRLAELSSLECRRKRESYEKSSRGELQAVSEPKTSLSADTFSSFSWTADLPSDNLAHVGFVEPSDSDNEFVALKRLVRALANRRNLDTDALMPKLIDLFAAKPLVTGRRCSLPDALNIHETYQGLQETNKCNTNVHLRKDHRLMTKASGFFHKLRPQLNIDTSASTAERKFSFEHGDDISAALSAPPAGEQSPRYKGPLRRSASLSSTSDFGYYRALFQEPEDLPMANSPPNSAPTSQHRKASRIPTPVYGSSSLARPRPEHEDSASSLLTAFKHSEDISVRSSPAIKSPNASPPDSSATLLQGMQGSRSAQRIALSNRLLEHTNALRGGGAAAPMRSISIVDTVAGMGKENHVPSKCQSMCSREDSGAGQW